MKHAINAMKTYFHGAHSYSKQVQSDFKRVMINQTFVRTRISLALVFLLELSNLVVDNLFASHEPQFQVFFTYGTWYLIIGCVIFGALCAIFKKDTVKNYNFRRFITVGSWTMLLSGSLFFAYGELAELGSVSNVTLFMLALGVVPILSASSFLPILVSYMLCNIIIGEILNVSLFIFQHIVVLAVMSYYSSAAQYLFTLKLFNERQRLDEANKKLGLTVDNALFEAKKANRTKSDFLARMSHDMRTPMNGIMGTLYLTLNESMPDNVRDNLLKIETSGKYLLSLINDTLDMSRIENRKVILNAEIIDSNVFFDSIITTVRPLAIQKNIDFSINTTDIKFADIKVDRVRVQQIFTNILSNAIKFTPNGGKVELIVECLGIDNTHIHDKITVRDNGIGMSSDFIDRIFEPFEQENTSVSNNIGSGLGMSIVKNLVELMNGRISVKSNLNKGTEMSVYLDFELANVKERHKVPPSYDETVLDGLQILLCEDHPLNTEIATKLLQSKGCIVEHAQNGQVGIEMFSHSPIKYYKIILMDIRMPILDGLEATKIIRTLDRTDANTIPIIAMTANAFDEDVEKAKAVGMNAHLSKPIEPSLLYKTIVELTK